MRLHHVQVACPRGAEDDARRFYAAGLGMTEVDKPEDLRAQGRSLVPRVRPDGPGHGRDPRRGRGAVRAGAQGAPRPAAREHRRARGGAARLAGLGFRVDWTQRAQLPRPRALPHRRRARQPRRAPGAGRSGLRRTAEPLAPRPAPDEDEAVGWSALERWGRDVTRVAPLTGGVANQVWSVRVDGRLGGRAARQPQRRRPGLGDRPAAPTSTAQGLAVPVPIATTDGRLFADGLVVMTYVEGRRPESRGRLAPGGGDAARAAPPDPGLAAAPGLALVDRPAAGRDRDQGRPPRHAGRGRRPVPGGVGAAGRAADVPSSTATPTRATSASPPTGWR